MIAPILRGAVHWVQLDKRRPAVVISPDRRNLLAGDVVVLPCSSAARPMSWHVQLRRGEGGLPADSAAKCEQITTVPKHAVSASPLGGRLSASRIRQLEIAILRALAIEP